jgi:hypothetical protein
MARVKRERAEQEYLPGTEPLKNNRVHPAAKRYAKERDDRIAANKAEKEAHDNLLAIMLEEGLETYEYGDISVSIDAKRKCVVRVGGADRNGQREVE